MKEPWDLSLIFSQWLGLDIPRREDYMAGGRWARESFYQSITRTAEYILEKSGPYLARKSYLQVERHSLLSEQQSKAFVPLADVIKKAQLAIANADKLGFSCSFYPKKSGPHVRSRKAYQRAFEACASLLKKDPLI